LLVFLVGQATPGYAGERIVDTLIGAGVAVGAVLLTPSAPAPAAVMSQALAPLHRCTEILRQWKGDGTFRAIAGSYGG
jgi:uncharacterized membrane protein YccC